MRKIPFPARALLVLGGIVFLVGLLLLLQDSLVTNLFSPLLGSLESAQIAGTILEVVGISIVTFGAAKAASANSLVAVQKEGEALRTEFYQTVYRLDRLIATQRATLMAMEASANTSSRLATGSAGFSNCSFCGTAVEKGHFCPKCGKAN